MKLLVFVSILTAVITGALCTNYLFGEITADAKLAFKQKIKYEALPLQKRVKYFSYNASQPIKAIKCFDYQNSEASVNVTRGGVGQRHVELRMKSQRSYRLEYAVYVYV